MKKTIAIVLMTIATSVFGSQQMQAAEARAQHIREVARARAERINREGVRTARVERISFQEAIARQNKAFEEYARKIDDSNFHKCYPASSSPTPSEAKQKKPRNSLKSNDTRGYDNKKFERSEPARRRK